MNVFKSGIEAVWKSTRYISFVNTGWLSLLDERTEFACLCCGATLWTLKHCVSIKDSRKGLFKMTNCEGFHFVH